MSPMVHRMNCYRLVPPRDGQPGYEQASVYVVADSFGEALAISDAQYPGYEVTGIVLVGPALLNIHKLPEAKA